MTFTFLLSTLQGRLPRRRVGALFAAGWIALPLVACGALKIAYDLALWRAMREHRLENH